ncbi:MAG: LamG-like jellyroll fold domain-containing protein, partial [Limnoraphis sp.]
LDANNGVTTNNGVVTGWADQSASGNDLTGFGDPTLVTNGLNGQNYINLDGDGDQLERDSNLNNLPSGNADRTVFMVAKYDGIGYGGFAYGKNFTNEAFGLLVKNDGDLMVQAWGKNDADSNVDGTGVGWLTQSAVLQAGTLNHYKDGTVIDSRTRTYNTLLDKIVLGSEIDGSPFVDMDVAEILVFDRALSEAEQTQVNNYLQQKYFSV